MPAGLRELSAIEPGSLVRVAFEELLVLSSEFRLMKGMPKRWRIQVCLVEEEALVFSGFEQVRPSQRQEKKDWTCAEYLQ